MYIREERISDYDVVYKMVKAAFETAEHSDGDEHNLVVRLRASEAFIPELSLVAVEGDEIVGYILFTKIKIGQNTALALAPLAVSPSRQRQGIGIELMREGHRIAKELGYDFSVVLGSEKYYPKAGYRPASEFGILPLFEVPSENFMALDLQGGQGRQDGTVEYAKEFFEA